MENKHYNTTSMFEADQSTLAHEQLARDEQFVAIFFSAFAIQFYLEREMLEIEIKTPNFIALYKDIELYASQRVFIKNLIQHKKFKPVTQELKSYYLNAQDKTPSDLFLSSIQKAFLIRQIFHHTDQILEKYRFVSSFINKSNSLIDMDDLNAKMWSLPIEQKIMICVYIFSKLNDKLENKKKTIGKSFEQNTKKLVLTFKAHSKTKTKAYENLLKLSELKLD